MQIWIDKPNVLGAYIYPFDDDTNLIKNGFESVIHCNMNSTRKLRLGIKEFYLYMQNLNEPVVDKYKIFLRYLIKAFESGRVILHCKHECEFVTLTGVYWISRGFSTEEAILHAKKSECNVQVISESIEQSLHKFEEYINTIGVPLKLELEKQILLSSVKKCSSTDCCLMDENYPPKPPKDINTPVPIMFIGENPSSNRKLKVAIDPNSKSGKALDNYYLAPLGLNREQVWITNLIKCKNKSKNKTEARKEKDRECKKCVTKHLLKELEIVQPSVIVTLSHEEVLIRFLKSFIIELPTGPNNENGFRKFAGKEYKIRINEKDYILFSMVHPIKSIPYSSGAENQSENDDFSWSRTHMLEHIPALESLLRREGIIQKT